MKSQSVYPYIYLIFVIQLFDTSLFFFKILYDDWSATVDLYIKKYI